jgi:hypothetical protein
MTTAELIIICVTVLALAAIVAFVAGWAPHPRRAPEAVDAEPGAGVVLHLGDGVSLRGEVVAAAGEWVLRDAEILVGGQAQPVGGQVRVDPGHVAWWQEL